MWLRFRQNCDQYGVEERVNCICNKCERKEKTEACSSDYTDMDSLRIQTIW